MYTLSFTKGNSSSAICRLIKACWYCLYPTVLCEFQKYIMPYIPQGTSSHSCFLLYLNAVGWFWGAQTSFLLHTSSWRKSDKTTWCCCAARLWLSLQAPRTERFPINMCQQLGPLQLGDWYSVPILPKERTWVGYHRGHDSCHRSRWYGTKDPRGFPLYILFLVCQYF